MPLDPSWLSKTFPQLSDIRPLSGGGQKWVFLASHNEHGRIILKIYHPGSDPQRALREVRSARVIEHAYVPDSLELDDAPSPLGQIIWVIEEHIPGRTLGEILKDEVPEADEILRWANTLLDILAEAEAHDIVHRDVKPGNIIIDPDGESWLLDFGLARHLDLESITATEANKGVGTPGYSPPEQFMNLKDQIDGRSDLFGLGVTLYECAEGRNPFREEAVTENEVYRNVQEMDLPPIAREVTEDNSFENLVHAMTRRAQEHRPPTVQFARDWMREIYAEATE